MRAHSGSAPRLKVSTMPRQRTEATAYLDIYKLVNEKKRLQQELETLEQRRDCLQQRLQTITTQVEELKQIAQNLRDDLTTPERRVPAAQISQSDFNTLFLEY